MRIIKPQQLILLKNSYQIGKHSQLGISVIAGCYLSRPAHFVTEPQIWEAWKSAPLSVPYLDMAIPKPFAEVVLAGHAGEGKLTSHLDVEMTVGKIHRKWFVQGESSTAGLRLQPFMTMPLDHCATWGGVQNKDNPLGKGSENDSLPNVFERKPNGDIERSALAAPTPIPENFAIRKTHLDQVAGLMSTPYYLDTIFPGLPAELDRRYFQLTSPAQWLQEESWEDETAFALTGFRANHDTLSGHFPAVTARAFCVSDASDLQEIELKCQTLWLLPDNDLGLMIFTGCATLAHIFDEPYQTLMISLDNATKRRNLSYFQTIYAQRTAPDAPDFLSLRDAELMPDDMHWNVIDSMYQHPNSLLYDPRPMKPEKTQAYYHQIEEAILVQQSAKETSEARKKSSTQADDIAVYNDVLSATMPAEVEKKSFGKMDPYSTGWENITFKFCTFYHLDFSEKHFNNCRFEQCNFMACHFDRGTLDQTQFSACELAQCHFIAAQWKNITFNSVHFEEINGQAWQLIACQANGCVFERAKLQSTQWEKSPLINCFFIHSVLDNTTFLQGNIESTTFHECDAKQISMQKTILKKSSILGGNWAQSQFSFTQFHGVSTGLTWTLTNGQFSECEFHQVGFKNGIFTDCHWSKCSATEMNCDESVWCGASVANCDFTGLRLKDADISDSHWLASSLQQALLYNANVNRTRFETCNFASANLARIERDADTVFHHCLLDGAHWLPRHPAL